MEPALFCLKDSQAVNGLEAVWERTELAEEDEHTADSALPVVASLRPAWRAVVCRADVFYRRKTDQNGGTESWSVWRKVSWCRSVRRDC